MAQSAHGVVRNDLESGFNKGVSRARANGLPENGIQNDKDELLNKIRQNMEAISTKEVVQGRTRPYWSSRGVEHAAEDLTVFEMAWRTDRRHSSIAMTDQEIEVYLLAFRGCGNCWSHD